MKTIPSFLLGLFLAILALHTFSENAAGNRPEGQPCTVLEDGTGTHPNIQSAVSDAQCNPVDLGPGTFTETVTINRALTIQGQGIDQTIVDGNQGGSVFTIESTGLVTMTDLTIRNGLTITGGGIANAGILNLLDSAVVSNTANSSGGGIHNSGDLFVARSQISGNKAHNWGGGGIYNGGGTTLLVVNSTLSANKGSLGGGIFNEGGQDVSIIQSRISGNEAGGNGGLGNNNDGRVFIIQSTIDNNSGSYGGGIGNDLGTVTVTLSTVSGNSAFYFGGGFNVNDNLTISHSTIYSNTAGWNGSGINFATGSLQLANSIIANSQGDDCYFENNPLTSNGYNLDSDGTCGLTATGDQSGVDPVLDLLLDNGGPTLTHALLPGSPALDAGSCPGITTDQRGYHRPVDIDGVANAADGCDIGAFEFQKAPGIFLPVVLRP